MAKKAPIDSDLELAASVTEEMRAERLRAMHGPESPEGLELGRALGANVAHHRKERGLSIEIVAKRSGIGVELLEKLEAGKAVPSLRAVWHLATALEVPFGTLLENTKLADTPDSPFRVQASGEGRIIANASDEFRSRVLFQEGDPRSPEVYELTLAPGCFEPAEAHAPETFEHIVVVRGVLIVRAGDNEACLGAGDSIFFRADHPHSYENPGDTLAVAHLIMRYGV